MPEKRMLILPAGVVEKINNNRGDMTQADFIDFLIDTHLNESAGKKQKSGKQDFVTREELAEFEQTIKGLMRNFIDFFTSYALDLGLQPAAGKDGLDKVIEEAEGTFTVRKPD